MINIKDLQIMNFKVESSFYPSPLKKVIIMMTQKEFKNFTNNTCITWDEDGDVLKNTTLGDFEYLEVFIEDVNND